MGSNMEVMCITFKVAGTHNGSIQTRTRIENMICSICHKPFNMVGSLNHSIKLKQTLNNKLNFEMALKAEG